jgi:hypothetical protein
MVESTLSGNRMARTHISFDEKSSNDPFLRAVTAALADADIKQKQLFDERLGQPKSMLVAPPVNLTPAKNKKPRPKKTTPEKNHTLSDEDIAMMWDRDVHYKLTNEAPSDLRDMLEDFRLEFINATRQAKSLEELITYLQTHVHREVHELFYKTNNLMTARTKYDYFKNFMDALYQNLDDELQLTPSIFKRLETLENAYTLGLDSYIDLSETIDDWTNHTTKSVLDVATDTLYTKHAEKTPDAPEQEIKITEIQETAPSVMRSLIKQNYHFSPPKGIPSPFIPALLKASAFLAQRRIYCGKKDEYYHNSAIKLRENPELLSAYKGIVAEWSPRIEGNPTPDVFFSIYQDLHKKIRAATPVIPNFEDMVTKAMQAAEKETTDKLGMYFKDQQAMLPMPRPRAEAMMNALAPERNALSTLAQHYKIFSHGLHMLPNCANSYALVVALEGKLEHLAYAVTFGGANPAALLAAQDYIAIFRKHLGTSMQTAGHYNENLMIALKEIETKADMMHENYREIGHWLMQDTEGAHDSPFYYALARNGFDSSDGPAIREALADDAKADFIESVTARNIPFSLAHHLAMPLIYARCRDIAEAEYTATMQDEDGYVKYSDRSSWLDRVTNTARPDKEMPLKRYSNPTTKEEWDAYDIIWARTIELLHESMCCLLPDAPRKEVMAQLKEQKAKNLAANENDGGEGKNDKPAEADEEVDLFENQPIRLTAHNLRVVMEYLDHVERERSPKSLH